MSAAADDTPIFTEDQQILASDGAPYDYLGNAVNMSENLLIVGASDADGPGGVESGAAYIYRFDGDEWVEEAKLLPTDGVYEGHFGKSVAIHYNVAVVAAHEDSIPDDPEGAVYVYRFDGSEWVFEQKILSLSSDMHGCFGNELEVNGDVIAIAACCDSCNCVWVYRHDGDTWQLDDLLYVDDFTASFGWGLGMDENQIIVGCNSYYPTGTVYIFRWDGADWVQDGALNSGNFGLYGRAVDIQGSVAVVGAPWEGGDEQRIGEAYIYTCTGPPDYEWSEAALVKASDRRWYDWFGEAVAVANEQTVIVQSMYHELDGYGHSTLYVFHQQGAEWVEAARLTTEDENGGFGSQAHDTLAADGTRVVVGSYKSSPNGVHAGSAYYYDLARVMARHVDPDAPAGGGGFTWDTAMPHLQDALHEAPAGVTIKLAEGTYKPDRDAADPGGTGDREAAFVIPEGVTLMGGYAGYGAPNPNANDPALYPTTLSGDLNGDDQPDFVNRGDNALHVVRCADGDGTVATIAGVTISGGYSSADSADPSVAGGAAVLADGVDVYMTDCLITDNHTGRAGGAVYCRDGSARFDRCTFAGNEGGYGAALNTRSGAAEILSCGFLNNQSMYSGGAIANEADLVLVNSLLTGNAAANHGGAISTAGELALINVTLADNCADSAGGGIRAVPGTGAVTIGNTILWANSDMYGSGEAAQLWSGGGDVAVSYSCVQGWSGVYGGIGNFGDDPSFLQPASGDYRLGSGSPCIDAGDNDAWPGGTLDLDGRSRFVDDPSTSDGGHGPAPIIDIGSYEFQIYGPCDPVLMYDGVDQQLTVGDEPTLVGLADINRDDIIDVVVTNSGSNDVSILLGDGSGSFEDEYRVAAGSEPVALALDDFNADGWIDIALANLASDDISILLGAGGGSFEAEQRYAVGDAPYAIVSANFNGDDAPDLATVNLIGGDVSVLFNFGTGAFVEVGRLDVGPTPNDIAAADLDGDGASDLIVTNGGSADVSIYMGFGNGMFGEEIRYTAGSGPRSVVAVDLDGNETQDLVVLNRLDDDVSVLLGQGDGSFEAEGRYDVGAGAVEIVAADFNDDGRADVAVSNQPGGDVSVLVGNGDGMFWGQQRFAAGDAAYGLAARDVDGDAMPDLIVVDSAGEALVMLNRCEAACIGDVDGDRDVDLSDLGALLASYELAPDDPWYDPRADVDGDGDVDLSDLGALLAVFDLPCP